VGTELIMPEQNWPDSRTRSRRRPGHTGASSTTAPRWGELGGRDHAPGRTGERLAARFGRLGFPARELAGLVSAVPVVLTELEI